MQHLLPPAVNVLSFQRSSTDDLWGQRTELAEPPYSCMSHTHISGFTDTATDLGSVDKQGGILEFKCHQTNQQHCVH